MQIKLNASPKGKLTGSFASDPFSPSMIFKTKDTADFLDHLHSISAVDVGLLPPAVRYVSNNKRTVVFERPPRMQTIAWVPMKRDLVDGYARMKSEASFVIPIPWQVYVVYFDVNFVPLVVSMYFRNSMLTSMTDTLGVAPILNFYNNSKLCNPAVASYEAQDATLNAGLNAAYNLVWNSGFNYDLSDAVGLGRAGCAPCHRVRPQEVKSKDPELYNNQQQVMDSIWLYYYAWSKMSLGEVLNTKWPTPFNQAKGDQVGEGKYTLDYALNCLRYDHNAAGAFDPTQQFMVTMVNNLTV